MKDETLPEGKWEFDKSVTAVFEDMLERSIPDYKKMRTSSCAVALPDLSRTKRPHVDAVLDLGCSTGLALDRLDSYAQYNGVKIRQLVGTDVSEPMLDKAREDHSYDPRYHFMKADMRDHFPFGKDTFDVVMCVLTLQFTPIEHRLRIVDEIHRVLKPGGRFILVEKVLGDSVDLDQDMVDIYYAHKRHMGYTEEQIERKRLSLEGVLVPITAKWNEELLDKANFTTSDCFWRWMNFAGWVAVK